MKIFLEKYCKRIADCAVSFDATWDVPKSMESNHEFDYKFCGYESCPKIIPDLLNVHIVSHTHDDVGWLKTVDQYYYGTNLRHQNAGVQFILDTVVQGLLHDPKRKFIYVESAFFFKWWNEQTDDLKDQVKMLVNEGRLEFIGGAWSMNDEAAAHYQSIIDQFTWGLRLLNDTFGECGRPKIGWQIDPFGHSREQASLFTKMGYDGMFFGRLDYRDKDKRKEHKTMEMIWKSSDTLDDSELFTGVLYNLYSPPDGFCYDYLCFEEPLNDNQNSPDYNIDTKFKKLKKYVENQATSYRTNNIILTMGGDFHYMSAQKWFKNLDKLIKYANERQNELKLNVFYSTPSCYLKALHESGVAFPTKVDDFFPYANNAHAYWTGYYTSRPSSKRFERIGNHFLQICKQLSANAKKPEESYEDHLGYLRRIMGVMQHHDAITGTEKQHVADDYHRELTASIIQCEHNTKSSLNQFLTDIEPSNSSSPTQWEFEFNSCLNLNISVCSISEYSDKFMVTVYNPLGHETNQFVRFPVSGNSYEVRDGENTLIPIEIVQIPTSVMNIHYRTSPTANEVVFRAEKVPAMGYKSYFVSKTIQQTSQVAPKVDVESVSIGNEFLSISFNSKGLLQNITIDGETRNLRQNFLYYNSDTSGAYSFRPDPKSKESLVGVNVNLKVIHGDLVNEVHQIFNEWISQVVRVYKNQKFVEFEWLVGPIPNDSKSKEIVTRFLTDIESNEEFFTDSNGRQMIKRKRNFRETFQLTFEEPIASNYYPISSRIAIEDNTHRLAILNDRAQGGASIIDGTLEIMVHRRTVRDDHYGVGEPLVEKSFGKGLIVRGKHWLIFGKKSTQNPSLEARERFLQNQVHLSNWLFFDEIKSLTVNEWSEKYNTKHSSIGFSLPPNIHLMTVEPWKDNSTLVRFEHLFDTGEDPFFSKPVNLNLADIFINKSRFSEVTLAANQWIGDMNRMHFLHEEKSHGRLKRNIFPKWSKDSNTKKISMTEGGKFTLNPMEILTFIAFP